MKMLKRFFRNIKRSFLFAKLGWGDRDFDYGYILNYEKFKYQKMYEYFKDAKFTGSEWEHARDLKIMLSLLDIMTNDDTACILHHDKKMDDVYFTLDPEKRVNTRNAKRFINDHLVNVLNNPKKSENIKAVVTDDLRVEKAWNLYHKIRSEKMRTWWD